MRKGIEQRILILYGDSGYDGYNIIQAIKILFVSNILWIMSNTANTDIKPTVEWLMSLKSYQC